MSTAETDPPTETVSWHGAPADARLHVVTGKGGTGKTTAAAALALTLADEGRHVLLAEVEERQGISQLLQVAPIGSDERSVAVGLEGGTVSGLSVRADEALINYLKKFYRLGSAGHLLHRIGAVEFATTIAPGVRDVLLGGTIYEAVKRTSGKQQRHTYDAVVLDAPPTGRVGRFLGVTDSVADLARVGPIRRQADSVSALLHSPTTAVHLVTLLEPMPMQETQDALEELNHAGLPLGSVLINRAPSWASKDPQTTTADQWHDLGQALQAPERAQALEEHCRSVGLAAGSATVEGLLTAAEQAYARSANESELLQQAAQLGRPVLTLAQVPEGIGPEAVRALAWSMRRQGVGGAQ